MSQEVRPTTEEILQERDALRDEVEGLKAAVDTVMRAMKIALKEHNQARAREAMLLDLLRQAEEEFTEARSFLLRLHAILTDGDPGDRVALDPLLAELEACSWFREDEDEELQEEPR